MGFRTSGESSRHLCLSFFFFFLCRIGKGRWVPSLKGYFAVPRSPYSQACCLNYGLFLKLKTKLRFNCYTTLNVASQPPFCVNTYVTHQRERLLVQFGTLHSGNCRVSTLLKHKGISQLLFSGNVAPI